VARGVSYVLCAGMIALGCRGRTFDSSRVRAGGSEPWCPIGMDAPTPADVSWTPPLRDPLARHDFFSAEAQRFPEQCSSHAAPQTKPENPCALQMLRVQ
jgi:hypothetical protein